MNFEMPTEAYPLQWPAGVDRRSPESRKRANFSHKVSGGWRKPLTIHQALQRLMHEIRAFTKPGRPWRVDPALVIVSTDMKVRKDGLPYSGHRLPDDSGCAVYFVLDGDPYVFPCDTWDRLPDNIAAVAAYLGAMRGFFRATAA